MVKTHADFIPIHSNVSGPINRISLDAGVVNMTESGYSGSLGAADRPDVIYAATARLACPFLSRFPLTSPFLEMIYCQSGMF